MREMRSSGGDSKHQSSSSRLRQEAKPSSVFASSSTRFQPASKLLGPSPGDYEVRGFDTIGAEATLTLLFLARSKARGARLGRKARSNLRASGSRANPTEVSKFRFVHLSPSYGVEWLENDILILDMHTGSWPLLYSASGPETSAHGSTRRLLRSCESSLLALKRY